MTKEQFRAVAAVCFMVITVCCVVAAFQLNGIKVAEQRQACAEVGYAPGVNQVAGLVTATAKHQNCFELMYGDYTPGFYYEP